MEKINPICIMNPGTDEVRYTLEFSRSVVKMAEKVGFHLGLFETAPLTATENLWFYAFQKNHSGMKLDASIDILKEVGGMTAEMIQRLVELYQAPSDALASTADGEEKNAYVRL
jgi:hypothetical protein